ncbi:unnamed protein product, partial [marine sediment metagenome]
NNLTVELEYYTASFGDGTHEVKIILFGEEVISHTGGDVFSNLTLKRNGAGDFEYYLNGTYQSTFTPLDNILNFTSTVETVSSQQTTEVNLFNVTYSYVNATISLNSPEDNYISSLKEIEFNATAIVTGGATLTNMSLWHNWTGTWERNQTKDLTGTTNTTTFNSTFNDESSYLWSVEACDSDGDCGFAAENMTFSIDVAPPIITINLPVSLMNYGYLNGNETLNWTIIDVYLDSIWFNYNGTNTTVYGANNETNFTLTNPPFNLTLYA